jgi:hypothetical protein
MHPFSIQVVTREKIQYLSLELYMGYPRNVEEKYELERS